MSKAARTGGASPRGSARKAEEDATRPAQHSYVPADPPVVGVVVSGAAARGPYEAGALAEVLPWLHEQGCRPQVLAGTSSGAITAVLLAQFADLGPDAGEEVVKVWEQISQPDVFRDVWAGLMLRAENILTPQHEPAGAMLDTTPLWTTGQRLLDPDRVAKNLRDDLFGDVAIAATFCPQDASSGYTRIFVQTQRAALPVATAHAVDYVKTTLEIEHILASAAIPVAFPPVLVTTPAPYRGWYIDGGVRLNTPIKPALDLDANRIVVISSHAVRYPLPLPPTPAGTPRPNLAGSAAQVLHAVLADALVDDLHRLGRTNQQLQGSPPIPSHQRAKPRQQGPPPDRCVPYLAVAPHTGQLARLATCIYAEEYGSRLRPPDSNGLLGRLLRLGGSGAGAAELLSYLFFDPTYAQEQVRLGREHAREAIARGWQTAPP